MKLIVAGPRYYTDFEFVRRKLDLLLSKTDPVADPIEIVSGKARGIDKLGERYAELKGYPIMPFPADWKQYGKPAGHIRNLQMAMYATHAAVFWDGRSKGSKSMIDKAIEKGLVVRIVKLPGFCLT